MGARAAHGWHLPTLGNPSAIHKADKGTKSRGQLQEGKDTCQVLDGAEDKAEQGEVLGQAVRDGSGLDALPPSNTRGHEESLLIAGEIGERTLGDRGLPDLP